MKSQIGINIPQDLINCIPENEDSLAKVNLIISCGGDGTILNISSKFQNLKVPPILPFSLGSLGFMSTFGKINFFLKINLKIISRFL